MNRFGLLLIFLLLLPGDFAFAGKSSSGSRGVRSSGGKSYSSGSKGSSSRPSSSSSRPSSSSSRPSSSSSRPSSSSSSRPSSSSSSKPGAGSSKPSSSTYDSAAAKAAKRAESRSNYSRRESPNLPPGGANSNTPRNNPAGKTSTWNTPAARGKSYSSGAPPRREDPTPTYQPGATRPTYNDSKGESRPIDPGDARVDQLRRTTNWDRWSTRSSRTDQVFRDAGPPPNAPVVVYRDPYANAFWWWLLAQSLDTRANWAYNHYGMMDQFRYRDMLARDSALEARIRQLEAQKVPREPTYTPPGVDPDLMYSDSYVESAVNPTIQHSEAEPTPARDSGISCFHVMLICGIVAFLIWIVFFKRWSGT